MKLNKGFTLIELLVVIAIIGILSSVVLASLNTARSKGNDSATKANLANMRAQAEIVYDSASSYAGVCTDTTVANMITAASKSAGTANCISTSTGWYASAPLKNATAGLGFWCVDSRGTSKEIAAAATSSYSSCN